MLVPHANLEGYRDDAGRSHSRGGQVGVLWRARSNVSLTAALSASDATYDAFFYRRLGDALSDTARIIIAQLDQPIRSSTSRLDYRVTTSLSVQWYAQAYMSRGAYSELRELASPRAARYGDRFRPYSGRASAGPAGVDFRQFRSNAVVRWEYRPGSTLFVVWTQGRNQHIAGIDVGTVKAGTRISRI